MLNMYYPSISYTIHFISDLEFGSIGCYYIMYLPILLYPGF